MHKRTTGPSLASDLHALAGLYATLFREVRKQAKHGHAWPPHRHNLAAPPDGTQAARAFHARR